ncbi:CbtA family protein [Methylobacterium sp. Leaf108]|uniref:CbtA family protein n=1 Tax=Methylobacterium sp. Leaf108 TaxID=1736256 RepID=UPI0006F88F4E|nr:CbtA family protein [Methylobacterium sp. Leaf108]KQP61195.1 cobalt transporter [Methylobacterium sp. Leaf108]
MIIRLLSAALVAGFLAAVVATGLQLTLTSPLILAAERYETQASHEAPTSLVVRVHAHGDGHSATVQADTAWEPAPGFQRMAFTGLATLVGGVGYALLLGAVLLACGREPTVETSLGFAVAGFLAVSLAPALGLPPELPGMPAAPLETRQMWWVMTALATAVGLYLIAIRRVPITILGGLVLIVAPHLAGAPDTDHTASALPAGYAAQFAARSLGIAFVFWAVIGLAFAYAWSTFGRGRPEVARG